MDMLDAVFVYQMHEKEELSWHQRIHRHEENHCEFHYFAEGTGTFSNGNRRFTIYPGAFFSTTGATVHGITADKQASLTYYAVLLDCPEESALCSRLEQDNPFDIGLNRRFFFEEIRDKALASDRNRRLSACHQLFGLLYDLAAGTIDGKTPTGESVHLEKAIRFMQGHVFDKLTLTRIAGHVQLDPSYFVRLFARYMHTTPMKYYGNLQLEAARALLTSTDLSVKEIAAKLQYCSEFHFSKRFKQSTGLSPTHYRRTHIQLPGQ